MKKIGLFSIAMAAALSLGAASAQTTIKIATLSPLSGGQSDLGTQIKNGAQLALDEAKAEFKKLGIDLALVGYDDQADPATGTAQARKIAADRQILAVVGTLNSGVAIPASEALAPSKVALVSPANTANAVTDRGLPNMNRIVARDDSQGPAAANYILNQLKGKKVYVLNDKTAYGEGLAKEVEKTLRAKGATIVGAEGTEEKANFQPLVIKIKALQPDVVYFGGIYDQIGVFAKQLREAGVNIPLVGGDGLDSDQLAKIAGVKGVQNVYFTTVAAPLDALEASKAFAENYRKAFGKDAQGFGAFGYDAAKVTLAGIMDAVKANNGKVPTRAEVEKAIRNVKVNSGLLSGPVQFNSVGDRSAAKLYLIKFDAKGERETAGVLNITAPRK